jgi:hypothetical protein
VERFILKVEPPKGDDKPDSLWHVSDYERKRMYRIRKSSMPAHVQQAALSRRVVYFYASFNAQFGQLVFLEPAQANW